MPDTTPRTPGLEERKLSPDLVDRYLNDVRFHTAVQYLCRAGSPERVLLALAEVAALLTPAPQGEPKAWWVDFKDHKGRYLFLSFTFDEAEARELAGPDGRAIPLYAGAAPAESEGRDLEKALRDVLFPARSERGAPLVRVVAQYEDGGELYQGHERQERARAALTPEQGEPGGTFADELARVGPWKDTEPKLDEQFRRTLDLSERLGHDVSHWRATDPTRQGERTDRFCCPTCGKGFDSFRLDNRSRRHCPHCGVHLTPGLATKRPDQTENIRRAVEAELRLSSGSGRLDANEWTDAPPAPGETREDPSDYLCGVADEIQELLGIGGPEGAAVFGILERRLLDRMGAAPTSEAVRYRCGCEEIDGEDRPCEQHAPDGEAARLADADPMTCRICRGDGKESTVCPTCADRVEREWLAERLLDLRNRLGEHIHGDAEIDLRREDVDAVDDAARLLRGERAQSEGEG